MPRLLTFIAAIAAVVLPSAVVAEEAVDYVRDVKPILAERCYACHGPLKAEQSLRVDTATAMRQGGDSGPAIVAGNSAASLLVERISSADADERMPAEADALSAEQITMIRRWIDEGAVAAVDEPAPDPREHWAFRPPVRPALSTVKNSEWAAHPIDTFLAAKHEERGLSPQPPVAPHVLLRRLYLDLIGLPPTPQQIADFGLRIAEWKAKHPEQPAIRIPKSAIEEVVDRLLESPQYGERWGRHWMDVWRYSDWAGYGQEIRDSQRHIWRWRDWIIESLNADKGYDRMILEMLAADELAPADYDALRATGFLARNWYKFNRNVWLDNTVEHSAKAFLGLTFNCARCHDHKYDPISQKNYYSLRAFFEPHEIRTDQIGGETDLLKDGLPRAYDAKAATPTFLFLRGNAIHPDKEHPLAPQLPALFGAKVKIQPVELPVEAYYPAIRQEIRDAMIAAAEAEAQAAETALEKARQENNPDTIKLAEQKLAAARAKVASVNARIAAELAKYAEPPADNANELAVAAARSECELGLRNAEVALTAAEQKLAAARAAEKPDDQKTKDAVAAAEKELPGAEKKLADAQAAMENPGANYQPLGPQFPKTSTGRRLALARWIADRNNPLTARVAVNHIWLRHFGKPLVDNMFDFGIRSPRPRHAELLDWLAVELMNPPESPLGKGGTQVASPLGKARTQVASPLSQGGTQGGWSMKHLHRLIVTSNAYGMTSSSRDASTANLEVDPDNHFLWRMNSRRLEAEAVRDSILHVAGNLDLTRGGPDIDHKQGLASQRRSIYFQHAYEKQMKFLELFDAASANECYRRSESIIPQQALALANSTLAQDQSRLLARRLAEGAENEEFITSAYEHVLSRAPTSDEIDVCQQFLDEQASRLAERKNLTAFAGGTLGKINPSDDPQLRAKENLVHVLMNHSEFVTIR